MRSDRELDDGEVIRIAEDALRRFSAFHDRVDWRRKHYYNDPAVDPALGVPGSPDNPFANVSKYQSDAGRQAAQQVIPRLIENHVVVSMKGPSTAASEAEGGELAALVNAWIEDVEERQGYRLQAAMAIAQVRDGMGLMHWRLDKDAWGKVEREQGEGPSRDGNKRYIDRVAWERAKAGCPFIIEFPDVTGAALVYDWSRVPGPALAVLSYEVSRLDYEDAWDGEQPDSAPSALDIGEEQPAPGTQMSAVPSQSTSIDTPSQGDYRNRISVVQVWGRRWYYELATSAGGGALELRKSFQHPYGRVPYEVIPAIDNFDSDPVYRWEAYLEGIYRLKPFYDRQLTLTAAIAEMTAVPMIYYERTSDGAPLLGEDGTIRTVTKDSALATQVPDGYTLKKMDFGSPDTMAQMLAYLRDELRAASPPTGQAEFGTSTAPWTMRLIQSQASVAPKQLIDVQARALKAMVNNWMRVCALAAEDGGLGEDVSGFSWSDTNGLDYNKLLTIPRDHIDRYIAQVDISPVDTAERTTLMQIMFEFAQKGAIRMVDFYEAMGKSQPAVYDMEVRADKLASPYIDNWAKAEMARVMGSQFVVGTGGEMMDAGGQQVPPEQVLARNGWQQAAPPQPPPGPMPPPGPQGPMPPPPMQGPMTGPGQTPGPGGPVGAVMPPLSGLQTPGTLPIGGVS